jgi:hypothetical protein
MNKKQITPENNKEGVIAISPKAREVISALNVAAIDNNQAKDNPKVYEAKIITPQPYGIYALCKIMEHFQIN